MIRSVRPTDLFALVSFYNQAAPNEVVTWEGVVGQRGPATDFLKQWLSLEESRHTWIYRSRGAIHGLASARHRSGPTAWEVDRLIIPGDDRLDVCHQLLEYLTFAGAGAGVTRAFLRLLSSSPLIEPARQAGFCRYLIQRLYRCPQIAEMAQPPLLRPRTPGDDYPLFRLYTAATPHPIRHAEAMTLQEWQETRESWPAQEWVWEREGQVMGWVRVSPSTRRGQLEVMAQPEDTAALEAVVAFGLHRLQGKGPIYCLVAEHETGLRHLLEEHGFHEVAEVHTYVNHIAVRVRHPYLAPARA